MKAIFAAFVSAGVLLGCTGTPGPAGQMGQTGAAGTPGSPGKNGVSLFWIDANGAVVGPQYHLSGTNNEGYIDDGGIQWVLTPMAGSLRQIDQLATSLIVYSDAGSCNSVGFVVVLPMESVLALDGGFIVAPRTAQYQTFAPASVYNVGAASCTPLSGMPPGTYVSLDQFQPVNPPTISTATPFHIERR